MSFAEVVSLTSRISTIKNKTAVEIVKIASKMTKNDGNDNASSNHDGNLLVKLLKWTDGLWNKSNRSVSEVITMSVLGEQETLYNTTTYHHVDTLTNGHGHSTTSSSSSHEHGHSTTSSHGHDSHNGSHEEYHLAEYFERAVEMINTVAGVIVLVRTTSRYPNDPRVTDKTL